ncbi:hypothetical protein SO802_029315 [Lithocarpus litseifolius]|uniref:Uncharacterized protein n=1 Tax=Lithocarpus litseifolius TaxID=425828 RepID=A0AAW2BTA5_9ROSI
MERTVTCKRCNTQYSVTKLESKCKLFFPTGGQSSDNQELESTDAAGRVPHRRPTWLPACRCRV